MPFAFQPLDELPDVVRVEPRRFEDDRGWFMEAYKASDFVEAGIGDGFVQDNQSLSAQAGVLRGIHYQLAPHAQGKLVRCLRGRIFDVAVDLREGSPTFGEWVAETLDGDSGTMLWVPPGFGHGFQALEDGTEVLYKATAEYAPDHERAIRWDDPTLSIDWPIDDPILKDADAKAPELDDAEMNFRWEGSP